MRRWLAFLLFVLTAVPCLATEKDVDPAHYATTAIVSDAHSVSVQVQTGTKARNRYRNYAEITATIGDTVYTLRGASMLSPGEYHVRFLSEHKQTVVEFLIRDAKGKPDGAKFYVVGMAAKPTEQPKPNG